jgi:hypothetical protein
MRREEKEVVRVGDKLIISFGSGWSCPNEHRCLKSGGRAGQ